MTGQPDFDSSSPAGQFTLSRRPGPGGRQTLAAVDRASGKPLAVHEIHFPPAATPDERRAQAGQVRWEADRLALLHADPSVLTVYGVVEEQNRLWLVTEALSGTNLARVVAASGPLPPAEAGRVAVAVLGALSAAHAAGVAHRGVRPAAVVRCDDGRVVLTGFCAAPVKSYPDSATLEFADPHRVRSGQATFGGDVFSFGSTLYYLLEGVTPFARPTPQAVAAAIQGEEPTAPRRAGPLTPVVSSLLAKDPKALPTPAAARDRISAVLGTAAGPGAGSGSGAGSGANVGVSRGGSGAGSNASPGSSLGAAAGARSGPGSSLGANSGASAGPGAVPVSSPVQHPIAGAVRGPANVAPSVPVPGPSPASAPTPSPGPTPVARPNAGPSANSPASPPWKPPPWTPSRTLWLLTALASTVTILIAASASWGAVGYADDTNTQAYTGDLLDILKSGAGGPNVPMLAFLGWLTPLLLTLEGTAFFGAATALVSRRMGRLCAAFALLGLVAEVGCYLWVADIPSAGNFNKPSVTLHAGGYLGLVGSVVAFLLGLAALAADRSEATSAPAPTLAPTPAVARPVRQVEPVIRIVAGVAAALALVTQFLPFARSKTVHISALEWSQVSVPVEACCLITVIVLALFFRAPRLPLTASSLAIPAALAFVLQVAALVQFAGINEELDTDGKLSLEYGCWLGLAATLVALAAAALGYRGARTTGNAYGAAPPYGVQMLGAPGYSPMPQQGGGYAPQAGYQPQQPGPGPGRSQG